MKSVIGLISIFLIIFLAASVDSYNQAFFARQGMSGLNRDIFYKTLGEFKDTVSDISYIKADVYYHGGVYDLDEDEESHGIIADEMAHEKEPAPLPEKKRLAATVKPSLNILPDIAEATEMTEHKHLSGNEEKEVIPWIYYAVRLNPHNKVAYAVGGFWLAVKLKKVDKAIEFLKEGLSNNADSYEICATLGQIYLLKKKDYKSALIYLGKAKKLVDSQETDRFDKRGVYSLLAETYIKSGDKAKAVELYKEELKLFPDSKIVKEKLKKLQ